MTQCSAQALIVGRVVGVAIVAMLAGLAVWAVLLATCVLEDSDEAKVNTEIALYMRDVGDRDYSGACGRLADSLRSELGGDCPAVLSQRYGALRTLDPLARSHLQDGELDARKVQITGSTATVADGDLRFEEEKTSRDAKTGKTNRTVSYDDAPDLTFGAGFRLTKVGDHWKIAGI
jgi:hypothetical protein